MQLKDSQRKHNYFVGMENMVQIRISIHG